MNALDFLIDFATLISTSVEPMPHQDENINPYIDPSHDPGSLSLSLADSLPFEQYHSTQQPPKENAAGNFTANPPSSGQILLPSANCLPDCRETNKECQSVPISPIQHDDHTSQVFNAYLQQDPSLGLPFKLTSIAPHIWHQQSEDFMQWTVCYEADHTLNSVPGMWYDSQIPRIFEPTQHQRACCESALEEVPHFQIPCNESVYHHCIQSPRNLFPTEDTWPTWSTPDTPFNPAFLPEYNEWALIRTPGTKMNAGQLASYQDISIQH